MAKRKGQADGAVGPEVIETAEGVAQATSAVYDPVNDPEGARLADAYMQEARPASLGEVEEPVKKDPEISAGPDGITIINW